MTQYQTIKQFIAQQVTPAELEKVAEIQTRIEAIMAEDEVLGGFAIALIGSKLAED